METKGIMKPLNKANWNVKVIQDMNGTWSWIALTEDDTGLSDKYGNRVMVEYDQQIQFETRDQAMDNFLLFANVNKIENYKKDYEPMPHIQSQIDLLD